MKKWMDFIMEFDTDEIKKGQYEYEKKKKRRRARLAVGCSANTMRKAQFLQRFRV